MKDELIKLWGDYNQHLRVEAAEYGRMVRENYGPMMYAPNKAHQPSFEGFMDYLLTTNKKI